MALGQTQRIRSWRSAAAILYSLIVTAKMNDVDPQARLADVLASIAKHPAQRIDELLGLAVRGPPAQAA